MDLPADKRTVNIQLPHFFLHPFTFSTTTAKSAPLTIDS